MILLNLLKLDPANPRIIRDAKFEQLCKSLQEFPQMMELRPIVVDKRNIIRGGNMRYKALEHLGYKEIPDEWVKWAGDLTDEQIREFIIKDNLGYGEWNWDVLANDWNQEQLVDWGLEILDFSSKNEEIDVQEFEEQSYVLKLEYTAEEYQMVKEAIANRGETAEKILYNALISV